LEGSSSQGEASRKLQRDVNLVKVLKKEVMLHMGKTRDGSNHGSRLAKGPREKGKS